MKFAFLLMAVIPSFVFAVTGSAQVKKNYTISGTIESSESGEVLIGATVIVTELKSVGASSNAYGFYSITIPAGVYTVRVQYLGYKVLTDTVDLDRDLTKNFALTPEPFTEQEVVVSGEHANANVTSTKISANDLQVRQLKSIPVLLGEKDVMKTIQLLPGIMGAGEGSTGFYARGGGADQNLVLLDEAPVYNPSHILGFLSVFNSDAIKDVTVMTGGIPAQYGGRLSSVVDIRTNDGNDKTFDATGGIGLLDSRLTLDGPIVKDKGSFIVSGRRTYADLFLRLSRDTTINRVRLYFYDLNAKVNYSFGEHDRLFLSGYFGRDNFSYPNLFGFNWGNGTGTLRWNHIFGDKFFSNTSLIYSDYSYANDVGASPNQFEITSGIRDVNLKSDFQYFMNPDNTMQFGADFIYHTFLPSSITGGSGITLNNVSVEKKFGLENALYLSDDATVLSDLKVNYGLRVSSFSLLGPGSVFTYNSEGNVVDTANYGSGKFIKTFFSLEPRITATVVLNDASSLKSSYTRTVQYLHLLSNSTSTNPSDLWVPSTNNVPPEYADQIDLGYFRNFNNNEYESSLVLYYKNMQNLIDYKNGADLQLNPTVESLLLYGRGWSYGAEFMLKKKFGALTGWIAYTLSRTEEKFAQINDGQPFPATQDRTHDVSIVLMYDLNSRWSFGATWVYYTGNAITFPSGNYMINGRLVPYYTSRNGYRMPPYNRLDLSVTWNINEHSNLNFSLYNAYDRMNPYAITFQQVSGNPNQTEAVQTTIFPIMPSITYNFKF
ncbi:MAG: TonB-dependent receptor [Bacteroidetes bacterium]|nr:TonB-dependent receptor [Bacteroidota bacterium]MCL5737880.1 TonB-dependent receptor [Bacteroidota bacterium]